MKSLEEINRMKSLKAEGKINKEIAKIMNIDPNVVSYHLSEGVRERKIKKSSEWFKIQSKKKKKEIYQRRKPYLKFYWKNRYHTDTAFRERIRKYMREWQKKHDM